MGAGLLSHQAVRQGQEKGWVKDLSHVDQGRKDLGLRDRQAILIGMANVCLISINPS